MKMFCHGQEVLFSYNTIKILGKNPSKPDTSRQNPESSHTHTPLQTLWAFFKNIFVPFPFNFLPSFLLSKYSQTDKCTPFSVENLTHLEMMRCHRMLFPFLINKKQAEIMNLPLALQRLHSRKWWMKCFGKICIYIHAVIMPTLNLLLELPWVNTVWWSCLRFLPVTGQFFLLLLPENTCSGIQICFSAYRHS